MRKLTDGALVLVGCSAVLYGLFRFYALIDIHHMGYLQ